MSSCPEPNVVGGDEARKPAFLGPVSVSDWCMDMRLYYARLITVDFFGTLCKTISGSSGRYRIRIVRSSWAVRCRSV